MDMATLYERGGAPRILLIDDNRGDARLIELAFKKSGLPAQITVAENAEDGMTMLRGNAGRPDLVFLDLNLPSMHGLKFLEIVKGDPGLSAIPVVVLSSSSAQKDVTDSYNRHANGFVTKPFNLDGYEIFAGSVCAYWFKLVQMPLARA
jgi:CheY-like chemotaxis protein